MKKVRIYCESISYISFQKCLHKIHFLFWL